MHKESQHSLKTALLAGLGGAVMPLAAWYSRRLSWYAILLCVRGIRSTCITLFKEFES